jgi:hypothetical protein
MGGGAKSKNRAEETENSLKRKKLKKKIRAETFQ